MDWNCFIADSQGRRFGNLVWNGKRDNPQETPDSRIILMDKKFKLKDRSVLEVGFFEGIHTTGLVKWEQLYKLQMLEIDSLDLIYL